ncbi:MAG: HNH endonuclease [Firmicutes bacterium]|nr:HNH endonuclease [Bacillota bacterium]MBE3139284.1 HNH endonuclease [Thermoplasmata archaeon]
MVENWNQYKDLKYYPDRVCACGCGGRINVRFQHKYEGIPKYIQGHNKMPKEVKEKLSNFYRGKTYKEIHGSQAAEILQHHREGAKKWERTEEAKANMSKVHLGVPHPHTTEQDNHISESLKKVYASGRREIYTGEDAFNWHGGPALGEYPLAFNSTFKKFILERYSYICMMCKLTQEQVGSTLEIHHIDYDKDNLDPDNFVPLCKSCHGTTNGNRAYWTEVLQKTVAVNNY